MTTTDFTKKTCLRPSTALRIAQERLANVDRCGATDKQWSAVERVVAAGITKVIFWEDEADQVDFRQLEISGSEYSRSIFVVVEVTQKKWRDTYAELLCSRMGHFRIGQAGGIQALVFPKGHKGRATSSTSGALIFGWRSFGE